MAQGHSKLFFRLEIIKKVIGIILLIIGTTYGIMGIAWSQVASGLIGFVINAYYTRLFLGYGALRQALDIFPTFIVGLVMVITVYAVNMYSTETQLMTLIMQVTSGVIIFVVLSITFKIRAYRDCVDLIVKKKS